MSIDAYLEENGVRAGYNAIVRRGVFYRIIDFEGGSVSGGSFIAHIRGTRGNTVWSIQILVTYSHSYKCDIVVLNSADYASYKLRAVVGSNGAGFIEFYDWGYDYGNDANQTLSISCFPLSNSTVITPITSLTSGASLPANHVERSLIDRIDQGKFQFSVSDKLTVSHFGGVTMPYQPRASVKLNSDNSQAGQNRTVGPSGYYSTTMKPIVFETVVEDANDDYDNTNGRFTCPIEGTYFVSANSNLNITNATGVTFLNIYKNGALYIRAYSDVASVNSTYRENWFQNAITAMVPCNKGDYLEIYLRVNNGYGWADSDTHYTQASFMLMA